MAELLKNIYSKEFFAKFIRSIQKIEPNFNERSFLEQIYDAEWEGKELKQRMRHISITLKAHLYEDFEKNTETILRLIPQLLKDGFKQDNLEFIFLPNFIEIYGIAHYKTAIKAFEKITQFVSCEFAVRPFIIEYKEEMIAQMLLWSKHEHPMVRRLSTEGCRPRLPWAIALPTLKKDPSPIIPILENLKNDVSESVRRSVANNLNDISKDNPAIVIDLVKKWKGVTPETDWLIKHGCRTLLKEGNPEVMQLFGFGSVDQIKIDKFKVLTPAVKIGGSLEFAFRIINTANSRSKMRLEYGVYYQKANGTLSRKVFKISEKIYAENSVTTIERKQPFKIITTRKLHIGKHQLSIIINGTEFEKKDFNLIEG